jgi:hypothetical protein
MGSLVFLLLRREPFRDGAHGMGRGFITSFGPLVTCCCPLESKERSSFSVWGNFEVSRCESRFIFETSLQDTPHYTYFQSLILLSILIAPSFNLRASPRYKVYSQNIVTHRRERRNNSTINFWVRTTTTPWCSLLVSSFCWQQLRTLSSRL